jgi:hypothetical protein
MGRVSSSVSPGLISAAAFPEARPNRLGKGEAFRNRAAVVCVDGVNGDARPPFSVTEDNSYRRVHRPNRSFPGHRSVSVSSPAVLRISSRRLGLPIGLVAKEVFSDEKQGPLCCLWCDQGTGLPPPSTEPRPLVEAHPCRSNHPLLGGPHAGAAGGAARRREPPGGAALAETLCRSRRGRAPARQNPTARQNAGADSDCRPGLALTQSELSGEATHRTRRALDLSLRTVQRIWESTSPSVAPSNGPMIRPSRRRSKMSSASTCTRRPMPWCC